MKKGIKGPLTENPIDRNRLRQLMREQNWTATQLSLAIRSSASYISNLLSDGNLIGLVGEEKARSLCAVLRCRYDWLFPASKAVEKEPDEEMCIHDLCMEVERALFETRDIVDKRLTYIAAALDAQHSDICRLLEKLVREWEGGNA